MIKKTKVILFSAKSQHGKDFTANIFKKQLEEKGYKVLVTHYADLLKYICKTLFKWDGNKDENGRTLLQHVGTDIIREQHPDYWVEFITNIITMFPNEWNYVLIPDTRFPNEIEVMKQNKDLDVISIRIYRPQFKSSLTEEQLNHASETSLDKYLSFDYYIENTTLEEVEKQVFNIIKRTEKKNKTIFIDLDGTVINTVKCITEMYDEDYYYYSDYEKIPWNEIYTWDFTELKAAKPEHINLYFNQPRFFRNVEMFLDAKRAIDILNNHFNIVFVSHGYSPNLRLKKEYIKKHFPYAEFIGVNLKTNPDKSCVDMKDGIFIDDSSNNLITSNADVKICFGKEYSWNKNWNGIRFYDWSSALVYILNIKYKEALNESY